MAALSLKEKIYTVSKHWLKPCPTFSKGYPRTTQNPQAFTTLKNKNI